MSNPFSHPPGGRFARPDDPLRPWAHPPHRHAYVLVDDMVEMYAAFCRNFGDLGNLDDAGHLVLVTGREDHGKSSLLGGCAAYLQWRGATGAPRRVAKKGESLSAPASRVKVVPLGGLRFETFDDLERYGEVIGYLTNRSMLFSEPARQAGDAAGGYVALSNDLAEGGHYLVVLLPPIDTIQRLNHYMKFARRRIVFLAESSPALLEKLAKKAGDDPRKISAWLSRNLADFPDRYFFHMHVGPLKPEDYWRYVREKLRQASSSVQVDENAVNAFRDQRTDLVSIEQWRDILSEIFDTQDLVKVQSEHFAPYLVNRNPPWNELPEPDGDVV
jgi:hypothetical protein